MLRGNQGRPIFYSDGDRVQCCLLIQEGIERFGHRIHGFCLMSNHIHLAWQQGNEGLSTAVQNLAFRYAQRINRFRKEVGHVFQGRFKSILVNKENYLAELVRYIHLNPVRAGIVKRPEDYKWSGHNAYLGTDPVAWVERDYVLKKYSENRDTAVGRYNEFIHAGIGCAPEVDFKIGFQSGIIGDDAFIKTIRAGEKEHHENEYGDLKISTSDIIRLVCSNYKVSETEITFESRSRDLAHVRAVITLLARELDGVTILEVAEGLNRSSAGLSRLANKLDRKCNSNAIANLY
jgi:REP element-mobilizing transposase RayT